MEASSDGTDWRGVIAKGWTWTEGCERLNDGDLVESRKSHGR